MWSFCKGLIFLQDFALFYAFSYAKLVHNCALEIHVLFNFLTGIVHRNLVFTIPGSQMSCTHKIYSEVVINKD